MEINREKAIIWKVDKNNSIFKNLKDENGKNFFYYLNMLNLENDPNSLILSSIHHYYYNVDDLKKVSTIIQVKELNNISDIHKFFKSIVSVLSSNTNLIGCFQDNNIYKNNIFGLSWMTNWILNMIDGKSSHYMSRKKVINILLKYKLEILDITEFDNLTYFYVKVIK
jgi:hypothetical protein